MDFKNAPIGANDIPRVKGASKYQIMSGQNTCGEELKWE